MFNYTTIILSEGRFVKIGITILDECGGFTTEINKSAPRDALTSRSSNS
jgi:hypothetical protein